MSNVTRMVAVAVLCTTIPPASTFGQDQTNAINIPDLTARSHHIAFPPSVGGTLKPGVIVDMSRPGYIVKDSLRLDGKADPIIPISQHVVAVVTRQDNSNTSRQVAMSVEASLSVFGGGRVGIRSEEFETVRQNSVYARLCTIDGIQVMGQRAAWPADWKLPTGEGDLEKLKSFVDDYGSHYIEKLYHGRSISIKATLREEKKERKDELEAKLKARLLTFSLDGEYVKRFREEMATYKFDLLISIQGGKADKPEKLLIRNLEELNEFIDNLRNGSYKVESVPVAADLLSISSFVADPAIQKGLRGTVKFVTEPHVRDPLAGLRIIMHGMAEVIVKSGTPAGTLDSTIDVAPPEGNSVIVSAEQIDGCHYTATGRVVEDGTNRKLRIVVHSAGTVQDGIATAGNGRTVKVTWMIVAPEKR